jgi:hypothetical protein
MLPALTPHELCAKFQTSEALAISKGGTCNCLHQNFSTALHKQKALSCDEQP